MIKKTNQYELKVQKIIPLQNIINQLSDIFTNSKKVIKYHIPIAYAPFKIEISKGKKRQHSIK